MDLRLYPFSSNVDDESLLKISSTCLERHFNIFRVCVHGHAVSSPVSSSDTQRRGVLSLSGEIVDNSLCAQIRIRN
jgi:hypothetical protein